MTVLFRAGYDASIDGALSGTIDDVGGAVPGAHAWTLTGRYFTDVDLTTIYQRDRQGVAVAYTLGFASAVAALQTALNASGISGAVAVTFSTTTRKFTITHNGAGGVTAINLTFNTAANRFFGTPGATALLTTVSTECAAYIRPAEHGGVTDLVKPFELSDDLGTALTLSDGNVEGLCLPGALQEFSMVFPLEKRSKTWLEDVVAGEKDPWPWELAYTHLRNVLPFYVQCTETPFGYVGKFREDACAFKPMQQSAGYLAYADIPFRAYLIGRP